MDAAISKKRKPKPRRRIDELDEAAATRRRTQARLAQQAFRRRKEQAIASLEKQVADLEDTINDLNETLCSVSDSLTSTGCLELDTELARDLGSTIQKFIVLTSSCCSDSGPDQRPSSKENDTDENYGETPTNSGSSNSVSEDTKPFRHGPYPEPNWSNPDSLANQKLVSEKDLAIAVTAVEANLPSWRCVSSKAVTTRPWASAPYQSFHDPSTNTLPTPIEYNSANWKPYHQFAERNFARRLNRETIEAGIRMLTCLNCHDGLQYNAEFERVFCMQFYVNSRVRRAMVNSMQHALATDIYEVEHLPAHLSNYGRVEVIDHGARRPWLSAAEIAQYLASKGLSLDGSAPFIEAELSYDRPLCVRRPTVSAKIHDQPTSNSSWRMLDWLDSFDLWPSEIQSPLDAPFKKPSSFRQTRPKLTIDMGVLIKGLIKRCTCLGQIPGFCGDDLDDVVLQAAIPSMSSVRVDEITY